MERVIQRFSLVTFASCVAFAQTGTSQYQGQTQPVAPPANQSDGAWHRFSDSPRQNPAYSTNQTPDPGFENQSSPVQSSPAYNQPVPNNREPVNQGSDRAPSGFYAAAVPQNITIPSGTWITVRTTNPISTDHNQAGDAFGAVLTQPIVVNGIVVARRGQSIEGRITESVKAGHVKGVSRLGLELIQVSLVDGQQIQLHTQMAQRNGNTSFGRDAVGIGTSTAVGAAIGGAVNGGVGAGVGAGIGLAASTLGVLLTRGTPAVIYPEAVLTFRTLDAINVSTVNSSAAFRPVDQRDYESDQRRLITSAPPQEGRPGPAYGAPYPYASPYGFGYGYGPGYGYGYGFGPSIVIGGYGRGYYGGGYYRGGGYRGGYRR